METTAPATDKVGVGSYIAAILLPVVGVIIAIVQYAKGNASQATGILLTSIVAWFVWAAILI